MKTLKALTSFVDFSDGDLKSYRVKSIYSLEDVIADKYLSVNGLMEEVSDKTTPTKEKSVETTEVKKTRKKSTKKKTEEQ